MFVPVFAQPPPRCQLLSVRDPHAEHNHLLAIDLQSAIFLLDFAAVAEATILATDPSRAASTAQK